MTKQPSYRFVGHTEPWEEKKLGEVAESFDYGLNASAKEFDGVNKYIRITDIDDFSNEFLKTNLTSPDVKIDESSDYLLYEGDILFTRTGASTGKTYYYKKTDGVVFFAGFLIRARIKEDNDYKFIFQNTLTKNFKKYVDITSQRSGQPGVNAKEYANFLLSLPSLPEQTAIGSFFQDIDQLISLQQRKLEVLKEQKKTYLKLLFPAKGQTKPALRFAGFEDDWKEVKLGESADYKNGKGYEDRQSDSGSYELINLNSISIDGGLKHSGKFIDKADETLEKGDLVMVLSDVAHGNLLGRVAIIPESNKFVLNQRVALLRPRLNSNSEFLYSYINSNQYYFKSQGAGMSQLNISRSSVENFSVYFPSLPEQEAIGSFFQDLDKAIAKQEEKVNQLKECKQTLLRKMFI
ncbi:restriction endonuclease subunit S [Streptococcus sp. k-378]|uniref:restriction endonuclease subunit S n=1 Tax=Streptococcus sp. k-378 TaxID=2582632 RepID=UPI0015624087|nr:restriction endonuclease subunit S [Streptococcus sp. k-378]